MTDAPKAVIFDLDETLAETFAPPLPSMIGRLLKLLEHVPVALCTAAGMPRIERDFLHHIAASTHRDRFYVFANSSAECFVFHENTWKPEYQLMLTEPERVRIKETLSEVLKTTKIADHLRQDLGVIVDRGAQVVYAALGLDVPPEMKKIWDPKGVKRMILADELNERLPDFESRIGGSSTIDITRRGVNKSYGVKWFSERLDIPLPEMLYIGDAFYPGGNDLVVCETGIRTRETSGPSETETIIDELIRSLETPSVA